MLTTAYALLLLLSATDAQDTGYRSRRAATPDEQPWSIAFNIDKRPSTNQLHLRDTSPTSLQNSSVGNSVLGTFAAPRLAQYLTVDTPLPQGYPWGSRTVQTNPYADAPETGVTRRYSFTIAKQVIAPDGIEKESILANGAFPGPTIEANWGDWVEVEVRNELDEGTSLHWHGLLQKASPWMDGVPGIQQCPIAPNKTFTYRFKADLYGTSWWHSHYSAQYADGLYGAIVIHGPQHEPYDIDLGPVLLADYYHEDHHEIVEEVMAPTTTPATLPPFTNNNLLNGRNNYPCAATTSKCTPNAGVSKFQFLSGRKQLLRLINAGVEGIQRFSIDGHTLKVISNDFVPIVPYTTNSVTLGVGQRSDVIVEATGLLNTSYWMRGELGPSALAGGCNLVDGISTTAFAAIYYELADRNSTPVTVSTNPSIFPCQNDALQQTEPFFAMGVDAPATTLELEIQLQSNGTHTLWYVKNNSFRTDYNDPQYLEAKLGNINYTDDKVTFNVADNSSYRIILYNNAVTSAHPMHIHGHNMYVLAEGYGRWNGTIVRPENPQRRDTHLLLNALQTTPSYMVLQVDADNAGVWPLHCHIASHVSAGLYFNILEKPDAIRNANVPSTMAQTCRDWSL